MLSAVQNKLANLSTGLSPQTGGRQSLSSQLIHPSVFLLIAIRQVGKRELYVQTLIRGMKQMKNEKVRMHRKVQIDWRREIFTYRCSLLLLVEVGTKRETHLKTKRSKRTFHFLCIYIFPSLPFLLMIAWVNLLREAGRAMNLFSFSRSWEQWRKCGIESRRWGSVVLVHGGGKAICININIQNRVPLSLSSSTYSQNIRKRKSFCNMDFIVPFILRW